MNSFELCVHTVRRARRHRELYHSVISMRMRKAYARRRKKYAISHQKHLDRMAQYETAGDIWSLEQRGLIFNTEFCGCKATTLHLDFNSLYDGGEWDHPWLPLNI